MFCRSVGAKSENVNSTTAVEDVKYAMVNSVTSYIEATLATPGPACHVHEPLTNMTPATYMSSFYQNA